MESGIDFTKGILFEGNHSRIKRVMDRAERGEKVTVGFLGGSITQGSLSSSPETCYAALISKWWQQRFPRADIRYVNAGIGATTSQFAVARAEQDLLSENVDFVAVEFSVNDENNQHFLETYEGLIRKIYGWSNKPAVLIINSVRYDNGVSAQEQHVKVGRAYGIPCIGVGPTIYAAIQEGRYALGDITEDGLHPNDLGHRLIAEGVTRFLESVSSGETETSGTENSGTENSGTENSGTENSGTENSGIESGAESQAEADVDKITPLSANAYEDSVRYQNHNCSAVLISCEGFEEDHEEQEDIRDIFRRGWTASRTGAKICFEVQGSCFALQYRKSVKKPAPIARAVIDGDESTALLLDGNFNEDWGDCLWLDTLAEHLPPGKHRVEITVTQTHQDDQVPFYLTSLIVSGR